MHELSDLSGLSVAEKDALILALFEQGEQVERLMATVQALSARVRELEGRLHEGQSRRKRSRRLRTGWPSSPNRCVNPAGANPALAGGA